jgi:hypothetical protein
MQAAFVLVGIALAIVVALLGRSRSRVSRDVDSPIQGEPDDLQNKFSTHGYVGGPHAGAGGQLT